MTDGQNDGRMKSCKDENRRYQTFVNGLCTDSVDNERSLTICVILIVYHLRMSRWLLYARTETAPESALRNSELVLGFFAFVLCLIPFERNLTITWDRFTYKYGQYLSCKAPNLFNLSWIVERVLGVRLPLAWTSAWIFVGGAKF